MLEVAYVAPGVERSGWSVFLRIGSLPRGEDDVVTVGKPLAGFPEAFAQQVHGEVYLVAVGSAGIAAEGVAPQVEGEAGVVVVVVGAEALVACDAETKTLGYGFYGEGFE